MGYIMLNHKPIIINGFSGGGTNIMMNIMLSHPDTAAPTGELHKVFKGGSKIYEKYIGRKSYKKYIYDMPIKLLSGQDIFRIDLFESRDIPNTVVMKYIDWILFREKQKAFHPSHNLFKNPGTFYTKDELKKITKPSNHEKLSEQE